MAEYKGAGDTVTIDDVFEVCKTYITKQEDIDLINRAYDYIMEKHAWDEIDQYRGTLVKGQWPTIPELFEMAVDRYKNNTCFSVFEPDKKILTYQQAYEKIMRGVTPLLLVSIVALLIVTFVPWLSLCLL